MEPPLDGAGAFAEGSGDLRNAFSVEVVHDDGFPVVFRKKRNLAAEQIFGFPAGDFVLDVFGRDDIFGEVDGAAGLFGAETLEKEVVRHAPDECAGVIGGFSAPNGFDEFKSDVLREVFGFLAGIHAEDAEAEDFVEVFFLEEMQDVGFRHGGCLPFAEFLMTGHFDSKVP